MENKTVVTALAALAQETRLSIFRLLVQIGPEGMPAGKIAEHLGIPSSSLSFHLKELNHAGLISSQQKSRSVIYTANYSAMNDLIGFLTENCCKGMPCLPVSSSSCKVEVCEEKQPANKNPIFRS